MTDHRIVPFVCYDDIDVDEDTVDVSSRFFNLSFEFSDGVADQDIELVDVILRNFIGETFEQTLFLEATDHDFEFKKIAWDGRLTEIDAPLESSILQAMIASDFLARMNEDIDENEDRLLPVPSIVMSEINYEDN